MLIHMDKAGKISTKLRILSTFYITFIVKLWHIAEDSSDTD